MNKETVQLQTPTIAKTSKAENYSYLIWCLILTNLFYTESIGLNALISCLITIPLTFALKKEKRRNTNWWIASLLWLICSYALFVSSHSVSILAFIGATLYFLSQSNTKFPAFLTGIIHSFTVIFAGWVNVTQITIDRIDNKDGEKNKWFRNSLIVLLPLIVVIIFLKLYQAADATFNKMTAFINLDWISWDFIIVYLLVLFLAHGLFFFIPQKEFEALAVKIQPDVHPSYKDKIEAFFGISNESKIAFSLLIILNLFLLLYNGIDFYHLFVADDLLASQSISLSVHGGINALITSLIMVMIIISYLFRGQLNFQGSKLLKVIAVFWLIQNCFMISTTLLKNFDYVHTYGLTYKRIGVYIYLFLAFIGICLAIYKILHHKNTWFLLRKGSITFAFILSLFLTFNWNKVIVNYNLSYVSASKIDYNYLINLGPDAYQGMYEYEVDGKHIPDKLLLQIRHNSQQELEELNYHYQDKSWRSLNLHDIQLMNDLTILTKNIKDEL
jgi:hypothetical protein